MAVLARHGGGRPQGWSLREPSPCVADQQVHGQGLWMGMSRTGVPEISEPPRKVATYSWELNKYRVKRPECKSQDLVSGLTRAARRLWSPPSMQKRKKRPSECWGYLDLRSAPGKSSVLVAIRTPDLV